MEISPLRCRVFVAGENLSDFILEHFDPNTLPEKSVLFVTSKIVSLAEGRIASGNVDKTQLIREEASTYLGKIAYGCHLSVTHGHLLISAGIDESNSKNGDYILLPKDPFFSARKLRAELKKSLGLKDLGVVLTDSRTTPLRRGVTGISLAHAGFEGITSHIGSKDIFGRPLVMTESNIVDTLAAVAVLGMGEGSEQRPLAILKNFDLKFTDREMSLADTSYDPSQDLYAPFIKGD